LETLLRKGSDVLHRWIERWARIVCRHPYLIVLISIVIAGFGTHFALQLAIKSDFAALLPQNAKSVQDLNAIADRMGGMGTLMAVVEGDDLKAMERFADDLAERLSRYPKDKVLFVDYKIQKQKEFFDKYQLMYLDKQELFDFREALNERVGKEKLKASGMLIELDDEKDEDDSWDWKKKKAEYDDELHRFDKYIDGYLTDKEGRNLVIVIKTPGTATGVDFAQEFTAAVEKDIAELNPTSYHASMQVHLTGSLKTLVEEYFALRDDILIVSNICVLAVLLAVALYYRSLRMTLIISLGLTAGLLTTMGLTQLAIGYLTASTAFLASIVAGNGINFGIYFMARYMEERSHGRDMETTLTNTLVGALQGIGTAATAAAVSYLSLLTAEFDGFNQFGFIGGAGMAVCIIFALTLDPALVVIVERHWPFKQRTEAENMRGRVFSRAAAWLVENHTRKLFWTGNLLVVASIVLLVFFLRDPFEYSFRKLRNQYTNEMGSGKYSTLAEKIIGKRSQPHIILADRMDQVPMIKDALMPYHVDSTTMPPEKLLFKDVDTIYDHLPGSEKEQTQKINILKDIRRIILNNTWDSLDKEDRELLDRLTPPADLKIITPEDLPDEILRTFIERDGTRGTPVYVYMRDGMSEWDGRDLQKFAAVVREVKLPTGEVMTSSGQGVIFADMLDYITREGPVITLLAWLLVLGVIFLSFRNFKDWAVVSAYMTTGILLMMGVSIAMGGKINFLNFIALPLSVGIGVDYHVNFHARFHQEGGSVGKVIRTTGGAIMMASSTTIIGYGALLFSLNGAINTFGELAIVGEFTCLSMALFFMPACLALFRKTFTR